MIVLLKAFGRKDIAKLIKKNITDKRGHNTTVWVRPDGHVVHEEKHGDHPSTWMRIIAFLGLGKGDVQSAREHVNKEYEAQGIRAKLKISPESYADHVAEYLAHRDKWDAHLEKRKPRAKSEPKEPRERKEPKPKADKGDGDIDFSEDLDQPDEPKEKAPREKKETPADGKVDGFNLDVMEHIAALYKDRGHGGQAGAKTPEKGVRQSKIPDENWPQELATEKTYPVKGGLVDVEVRKNKKGESVGYSVGVVSADRKRLFHNAVGPVKNPSDQHDEIYQQYIKEHGDPAKRFDQEGEKQEAPPAAPAQEGPAAKKHAAAVEKEKKLREKRAESEKKHGIASDEYKRATKEYLDAGEEKFQAQREHNAEKDGVTFPQKEYRTYLSDTGGGKFILIHADQQVTAHVSKEDAEAQAAKLKDGGPVMRGPQPGPLKIEAIWDAEKGYFREYAPGEKKADAAPAAKEPSAKERARDAKREAEKPAGKMTPEKYAEIEKRYMDKVRAPNEEIKEGEIPVLEKEARAAMLEAFPTAEAYADWAEKNGPAFDGSRAAALGSYRMAAAAARVSGSAKPGTVEAKREAIQAKADKTTTSMHDEKKERAAAKEIADKLRISGGTAEDRADKVYKWMKRNDVLPSSIKVPEGQTGTDKNGNKTGTPEALELERQREELAAAVEKKDHAAHPALLAHLAKDKTLKSFDGKDHDFTGVKVYEKGIGGGMVGHRDPAISKVTVKRMLNDVSSGSRYSKSDNDVIISTSFLAPLKALPAKDAQAITEGGKGGTMPDYRATILPEMKHATVPLTYSHTVEHKGNYGAVYVFHDADGVAHSISEQALSGIASVAGVKSVTELKLSAQPKGTLRPIKVTGGNIADDAEIPGVVMPLRLDMSHPANDDKEIKSMPLYVPPAKGKAKPEAAAKSHVYRYAALRQAMHAARRKVQNTGE